MEARSSGSESNLQPSLEVTTASLDQPHAQHVAQPILDLDVFRAVLSYLPLSELLNMTLASRFVGEEATRELLRRPVYIAGDKRLRMFCHFALSGDPGRLGCLRKLTVRNRDRMSKPTLEDQQHFARVLTHCLNLTELNIYDWGSLVVEGHRSVCEAISTLLNLTHFSTVRRPSCWDRNEPRAVIIPMVVSMKASLRVLHLSLDGDVDDLQGLAMAHRTLEVFSLRFSTFISPAAVFSAVRVLYLACPGNIPLLRDLYRAFPKVRELSISVAYNISGTGRDRAPQPLLGPQEGNYWRSLDFLRASPSAIDSLGIACPVRCLQLGYCAPPSREQIAHISARLRPKQVILSHAEYEREEAPSPAGQGPLLRDAAERNTAMKFLLALFMFTPFSRPNTHALVEHMRAMLHSAPVELLHLAVSDVPFPDSIDPDEIVRSYRKIDPVGADWAMPDINLDVDALARNLATACPSIRTLAITVAPVGYTVWRVEWVDGKVLLAKLGAHEGRQTLEREAKRCLEE